MQMRYKVKKEIKFWLYFDERFNVYLLTPIIIMVGVNRGVSILKINCKTKCLS